MLRPNDLRLLPFPGDLSDEAAAQLVEFLYDLTEALERHCAELHHCYHPIDVRQCDLDLPAATHVTLTPPPLYRRDHATTDRARAFHQNQRFCNPVNIIYPWDV